MGTLLTGGFQTPHVHMNQLGTSRESCIFFKSAAGVRVYMSLDHTWISKAPMKCLPTLELWVKCLQCLDYFLSRVYVALHPIVQSLPSNLWLVDLAMRLTLSKKSSQIGIELTDVIWAKASKGPVILYFYHSYENGLSGATGPQEWGTWDRVTRASAVLGVQEPETELPQRVW